MTQQLPLFAIEQPTGPAKVPAGVESGATFSPCRKFRYKLWRQWNLVDSPRFVAFIGVNPSVADEYQNDRTITRCINFAKSWGYDGLKMLNAFAWIQTSLTDELIEFHIGDDNDRTICESIVDGDRIIAAWGTLCPLWRERQLVAKLGLSLECLDFTKDHRPKHPLYVRGDAMPKRF